MGGKRDLYRPALDSGSEYLLRENQKQGGPENLEATRASLLMKASVDVPLADVHWRVSLFCKLRINLALKELKASTRQENGPSQTTHNGSPTQDIRKPQKWAIVWGLVAFWS